MGQTEYHKSAPINEIVGLLHSFNETELTKLKDEFPEYSKLLKPGITLGVDDDQIDQATELKVRVAVSKTGLKLILSKSEHILPKIKSRLKILNNVQFVSQVIIAISGASILAFLQERHGRSMDAAVGILTLSAALLTLFVQHKSGTIALGENSLSRVFNDLTDNKINAEYLLEELRIIEELNFSSSLDQVSQIIKKSNDISLRMKKIIEKY